MNLDVIHHVAIIVSDYAKSRHFYVDLQGFEVIREHHREDKNDYKLDLKLGSCELEIFGKADAPKRVNNPEACGLRHLAFKVECIEKTVAELEKLGIECEPIRWDDFTQKKMTFFKDPDGLPLELHEQNINIIRKRFMNLFIQNKGNKSLFYFNNLLIYL